MRASELRIENYYNYDCDSIKLDGSFLAAYLQNECDYILEPIPLTEEWLLKFGFVYNGWSYLKGKYFFHAQMKNKNGEFQNTEFYVKDCLISYNIEFVHQLQNLYFALTGKEL